MLKIRYLCGRNDNALWRAQQGSLVVICSKFAIFAVEMTTEGCYGENLYSCDLLKIRYLCGRNDNFLHGGKVTQEVVICSKFAIFAVEMTTLKIVLLMPRRCDLLKIRYLCGRNDNDFY